MSGWQLGVVSSNLFPPGLASDLANVIDSFKITTVIDVGAHVGGFGTFLRKEVGFQGEIISFEPAVEAFKALSRLTADDEKWSIHNFALGNEDGEFELHKFSGTGYNSLHKMTESSATFTTTVEELGNEVVRVQSLAGVIESLGLLPDRILLKSDTQGHDLEVLRGAGPALQGFPALILETSVLPLYEDAPAIHETLTELADSGFEPAGFFPIHHYGIGNTRVIEFDCILLNRAFL